MRIFSRLKALFSSQPRLGYGRSGPPLSPEKRYEFTLAASFDTRHAADMCVLALKHLNLAAEVTAIPNGRWNADFTFTMKGDPVAVDKIKSEIDAAVQRQGGQEWLFAAGAPRD